MYLTILNTYKVGVPGISELWLTPSATESFINIHGILVARADSPNSSGKHSVVVFVNKLKFYVIDYSMPNAVIVFLVDFCVYIINIYRPPSYSLDNNGSLMFF